VRAERSIPFNPDALTLTSAIDRRQGRWEESTKGLEKACALDPRNSQVVEILGYNYLALRRYRDSEKIFDRLTELEPDKPFFRAEKAYAVFCGSADLLSFHIILEALPSSLKDEMRIVEWRLMCAEFARDWRTAEEIIKNSSCEEFCFFGEVVVHRKCVELWLALLKGEHPTMEAGFAAARDLLNRKVEARPRDGALLGVLGIIDAALGRKHKAIQEAKRAVEILPISQDAIQGVDVVENLALVYALTHEPDLAFQQLAISVNCYDGISYGELKLDPAWDPLRTDPRFDKLLAQLAPKE
jgi:tetratricopeptide (TPR) repeat protein